MHNENAPPADAKSSAVDCPLCEGSSLMTRQCKSVCPTCGYVESCEDNFVPNQSNPVE